MALLVLLVACERAETRLTGPATSVLAAVAEVAPVAETMEQEVPAGTVASIRPTLFVRDANGRGVPGVPVYFRPRVVSGTLTFFRTDTDSLGRAVSAPWTISNALGPHYVDATVAVPGFTGPYTFTATSVVGPPAQLAAAPDTLVLAGGAGAQLSVTATDQAGHPVTLAEGALTFTSTNDAVATVSASGAIEALGGGLARIRASLGTIFVEVPVAVNAPAVADFVVTVPASANALSMAVLDGDAVLVGAPDGFGYRARMPFPGVTSWSRWIRDLAYIAGESNYYVAGRNAAGTLGEVRSHSVVDASSVILLQTSGTLLSLVVDPVNDWIFVGRDDGRFIRIDRVTQEVDSVSLAGPIFGIAPYSANGSVFVTAGNFLYELDGATLAVLRSVDYGNLLVRVALVASNTHLILVSHFSAAVVLDRATLVTVATLNDNSGGYDVKVHPSGDRFAISSNSSTSAGRVVEYETGSWAMLRIIPLVNPLRLAYNASGYVLMVTRGQGQSIVFLR